MKHETISEIPVINLNELKNEEAEDCENKNILEEFNCALLQSILL